jgi:hypothetical protein
VILSRQEAELFYDLTSSLQYHINQKLNIVPAIGSLDEYRALTMQEKFPVRNAVYEHIGLIDEFVRDNPQQFSQEELANVLGWKTFVRGKFYIERYLKKYAIFIGPEDKVYAVHGLMEPLDNIIDRSHLPQIIDTVLLPFADKVIYDGIVIRHQVFFGRGLSEDLKEIYLAAKSRGEIIESFRATQKTTIPPKMPKNWQPKLQNLQAIAETLQGGRGQPALYSPVFSLIKAAIALGNLATAAPSDTEALWQAFDRASRALDKTADTLQRRE